MQFLFNAWGKGLIGLMLVLTSFVGAWPAQADSPLTSTNFSAAYDDLLEVRVARRWKRAEGMVLDFLLGSAPLDQKVAVVNALGWDIDDQTNSIRFVQGVAQRENIPLDQLMLKHLNSEDRAVLGYLLAMDDYQQMLPLGASSEIAGKLSSELKTMLPDEFLNRAIAADRNDFTTQFVASLVEAQRSFGHSWCDVYLEYELTLDRFPKDTRNMRQAAVDRATEYMMLYQSYCHTN